jgi:hypothetical protein
MTTKIKRTQFHSLRTSSLINKNSIQRKIVMKMKILVGKELKKWKKVKKHLWLTLNLSNKYSLLKNKNIKKLMDPRKTVLKDTALVMINQRVQ